LQIPLKEGIGGEREDDFMDNFNMYIFFSLAFELGFPQNEISRILKPRMILQSREKKVLS
jgi:hypothetical protein